MAQQVKRTNDFKDKSRPATITGVDPQNKKVHVKFTTQDGEAPLLDLSYANVGATWGRLYMPQIGDRVYIDYTQGEVPVIVGMKATNVDFLPYLDPGEMADVCSDGSFIHFRNKRRRVKSTGELIDYDAKKGPNGETDIETEPGGIILGVRSKKDINTKAPRWYEHSYVAMYDNGDVAIQSRYQSKEKGLLYFDGAAGYSFWTAGDGRPQEYIELDPLNKAITIVTDGDVHQHTQKDWKITVLSNHVEQIGHALQVNVGLDTSQIPGDFDQIKQDNDLGQGDIRIKNQGTQGSGKFYLSIKGDANIDLAQGDFNVTTHTGKVNIIAQGDVNVTSHGNTNLNSSGTTKVTATGEVDITGSKISLNGGSQTVATIDDVNHAIQTHKHQFTKPGSGSDFSGTSPDSISNSRQVFT